LTLAWLAGNESITHCHQVSPTFLEQNCGVIEMRRLRMICPISCGCHEDVGDRVGFFGSGDWGCPNSCKALRSAAIAYTDHFGTPGWPGSACVDMTAPSMLNQSSHFSKWFRSWVVGLFQYLRSNLDSFRQVTTANVKFAAGFFFNENVTENITDHIVTGAMAKTIMSGSWELMPGVPHPYDQEGCAYLTGFVFQWLLGIDPCRSEHFRSLTLYCPVACACGSMVGCPGSCTP